MNTSKRFAFKVTHPTYGDCGNHKTEALARKRVARIVAMSKGKLSETEFNIEPI